MPLTHITYITWDDILINAVLLWILIKTIILWNWWDVTLPSTISNHSLHPVFSFHLSILTSKKNIPKRKWTLSIFLSFEMDERKEIGACDVLLYYLIFQRFPSLTWSLIKTTILHLPSSSISMLSKHARNASCIHPSRKIKELFALNPYHMCILQRYYFMNTQKLFIQLL